MKVVRMALNMNIKKIKHRKIISKKNKKFVWGTSRDISERKKAEIEQENLRHDMGKRIKELQCLYGIAEISRKPGITIDELFKETVDLLPPGWQYPEIACARITVSGNVYKTKNFKETQWTQKEDIYNNREIIGTIEICYLNEKPHEFEGPFLKEERDLINDIARQLGNFVIREKERIYKELQNRRAKALLELPVVAERLDELSFMQHGQGLAEELTDSSICFIHFVNDDDESIELVTWSRRTLQNYCNAIYDQHYPIKKAGIWADAQRQQKPVLINDYLSFPGKQGLPEGHAELKRFISVPVIENGKVVMLTGVGNKNTDYNNIDVETVQLISNEIWHIVQRRRNYSLLSETTTIINRSPAVAFLWKNVEGKPVVYVSENVKKIFGYSSHEFLKGKILYDDIIHKDDFKRVVKEVSRFSKIKDLERFTHEPYRIITKTGNIKWLDDRTYIRRDSEGIITHFEGIVYDITERKRMERALKLSEEKFSNYGVSVFNTGPVVIFKWQNSEGWPVEYVSNSVESVLGYSAKEFLDQEVNYIDIILKKYHDRVLKEVELNSKNKKDHFIHDPYELIKKNGEIIFISNYTTIVYDISGKVTHILGYIIDITKQKKAEKKIIELNNNLQKALLELEISNKYLKEENIYLQEEIKDSWNLNFIVGKSSKFINIIQLAKDVGPSDTTVLITGETGTGKELIANAIHSMSQRSKKPLIKLNCTTIPENLIESELFGHEKGAFTGAIVKKIGRFELADNGTLFLDEIGELPLNLQPKLLRVIQEGEFERIGGTKTIKVDVRIVSATNKNLEEEVNSGRFRSDLFYRLNVFPIHLPSLRERNEDIPLFVEYFVKKYADKMNKKINIIPKTVLNNLKTYHWPGNIRELENIIERAVVLTKTSKLIIDNRINVRKDTPEDQKMLTLDAVQKNHILSVLTKTNGKISGDTGAANILGIKSTTLRARMLKLNIK